MILDGHAHVILPAAQQIASMDAAGVGKTLLFMSRIHPEKATDLATLEAELDRLNAIIAGHPAGNLESHHAALAEQIGSMQAYPQRFVGFGAVPLGLSLAATAAWLQSAVLAPGFRGLGEFTLPPGQMSQLAPLFPLAADAGNLPIWVHTFAPLTLTDIHELVALARRYASVPIIFGHMGGVHWRDLLHLLLDLPNGYVDLSAAFTLLGPATIIRALPDRACFGSDAPYGDPYLARMLVERATADTGIQARVLGANLAELLQLSS